MSLLHTHPRAVKIGLIAGSMAALLALSACGTKVASGTSSSTPSAATSIAPSATAPAAAVTVDVVPDPATIGAFNAPTVTITAGQSVKWVFQDANPHTVTADDGSFTSTQTGLANGATYVHTFSQAGTFTYHCFIHPQMHGTVIVQ